MKAYRKYTIAVAAFAAVLLFAGLLVVPVQELVVPQLGAGTLRAFLDQLAAQLDHSEGRNFLEAVPVAADPGEVGDFGAAAAVDGDTAVIGAPQADGSKGAVFVFERVDGQWLRKQKLVPADRSKVLQFGLDVDLDGDMLIVGASGGKNDPNPGSAFIFKRDGSGWREAQKLAGHDGRPGDGFGTAVALGGSKAVVGAIYAARGDTQSQGAAYVFSYFDGRWSLEQKLTAKDGKTGDAFGIDVDIQGNTVAAGAAAADIGNEADQGAVYIFTEDRRWTQRTKLIAFDGAAGDQFGGALALDEGTLLVGARNKDVAPNPDQGAAYVYTGAGAEWDLQQRLTVNDGRDNDGFGASVALQGDTAFIGATGWDLVQYWQTKLDQGAVYIFTRSGDLWSRSQDLISHDGEADDLFGSSLALDGDTAVVGAVRAMDLDFGSAGKFYVTERGPQPWPLAGRVRDSDANGCPGYGYDVGLEGTTAVVNRSAVFGGEGAVYFYTLEDGTWKETQTFNLDGGATSIALQGDTAVIGAAYASGQPGKTYAGAAYVFTREGGVWKQQQKLVAADSGDYDHFGEAVALDGGTLMVGAPSNNERGAVYFYRRSGASWALQQKLVTAGSELWDYFGRSIALEGSTAIIGASNAAFVFRLDGGNWKEQQKLVASGGSDFGVSVALDGESAVIGDSYQQAAYIFGWDGSKWVEEQKLVAADDTGYSALGRSVDLDGNTAVIGAVRSTNGTRPMQGAVYVFRRDESEWQQTQKLIPPADQYASAFGYPALDGEMVLIGAPGDDYSCSGRRRFAYFFQGLKLVQAIDFPVPAGGAVGESMPLTAVASSDLPVTYVSKSPDVCSVSGDAVLLLKNGVCRITASQLGDDTYAPAEDVTAAFHVGAVAYQMHLPIVGGGAAGK